MQTRRPTKVAKKKNLHHRIMDGKSSILWHPSYKELIFPPGQRALFGSEKNLCVFVFLSGALGGASDKDSFKIYFSPHSFSFTKSILLRWGFEHLFFFFFCAFSSSSKIAVRDEMPRASSNR